MINYFTPKEHFGRSGEKEVKDSVFVCKFAAQAAGWNATLPPEGAMSAPSSAVNSPQLCLIKITEAGQICAASQGQPRKKSRQWDIKKEGEFTKKEMGFTQRCEQ